MQALMVKLFQPVAHFRDPQISDDEFIATLNLPTGTTIAGMLAYLCDQRFSEQLKFAVIGKEKFKTVYTLSASEEDAQAMEMKEVHFSRGESADYWKVYRNEFKSLPAEIQRSGQTYLHYKQHVATNRLTNYEVLRDLQLTIFISGASNTLTTIRENLLHPKRYVALGRKEDTAFIQTEPKLVNLTMTKVDKVQDAIGQGIFLANTYMPLDRTASQKKILSEFDKKALRAGSAQYLSYSYQDLTASKVSRRRLYRQYVYVNEPFYPIQQNIYQYRENNHEIYNFMWM